MAAVPVRELELDLDAFEGPFDLLLSLVLREELPLAELDLAQIVVAFVSRLAEREELLRIDPAHKFGGLRLNAWVSIVVFLVSTGFFIWWQFIRDEPAEGEPGRARAVPPPGPAMAVPKGRVR